MCGASVRFLSRSVYVISYFFKTLAHFFQLFRRVRSRYPDPANDKAQESKVRQAFLMYMSDTGPFSSWAAGKEAYIEGLVSDLSTVSI